MDELIKGVIEWLKTKPMVGWLVIVILLDIASGVIVAASHRRLNSSISMIGMSRKAFIILLVGLAAVLEHAADGELPLTNMIAVFFIGSEGLSIIENAIEIGLPVPKSLKDMLAKFRDTEQVEVQLEKQIVRGHFKRPSDVVDLPATVPKQTGDSEGCNQPSRPS